MATSAKIRKNPETNVAGAEISGNYASRRLLSLQNCLRRNFRFSVFLTVFRSRGGLFGHAAWPASDGFRRCRMAGRVLRLFQSMIFVVFVTADFVLKCCCFPAARPPWVATEALRQCNGALAATPRGPYGRAGRALWSPTPALPKRRESRRRLYIIVNEEVRKCVKISSR